ncbi:ShlB/FhaC/HecB family hemolysin secretion/activation protein [Erythrobacter sp. BLCC-B19]|uniref:ShlB/FhaC/HecB family hemolysin secretion/activation protein n=1 Tax=Erythrobacter sp. BLCC-B19 TaxID=3025315 RepID=UPI002360B9B1|nr:ShlB/FhaC/HecB family hemolysin secretion/activation protein [Erythrobacter sp. BLCC-B19]WDA41887.1 ShlB/FhaC/HecB family hemolysin secretion/activation protein [Erythrobacter sp. BLCC-B19]
MIRGAVNHCGATILLLATTPLAAQDVLDRTNPGADLARDTLPPSPAEPVRIEVLPVLDTPLAATGADTPLDVGAIVIDGLTAMNRADFAATIEPFAGRPLARAELARLTDAIAARARAEGYVLATAWIPEQTLTGGMLRVRVDEGAIDAVRVEGSDDPAIRRQLERLVNDRPLTLAALQRAVLLADDLPGVWIRSTRFEREGQRRILVVDAGRSDASGAVQLATDGTKPLGPVRARIDFDANGLISPRDRVDLSISLTPLDPEELAFFSARYSVIVNDAGTSLGAFGSFSRTEPGAYLANRELLGEAWQGGLKLRHPLMRAPQRSLWLEASGEVQDLRQDRFGTLARHDRIALARLGFYGFGRLAGGNLQGRATVSQGLPILAATDTGDPLASRLDAAPDFTTLSWWLNWRRGIAPRVSLQLASVGQLSTAPLLIGESFTLGGNSFLRGYDFAQRVGDEGAAGLIELRYDWPRALGAVRQVQLYAFADGGTVSNLEGGLGGGTLASSGAGLRTDITRDLDLDFEVAVPLTEDRYDTGDNSPRLNLRVSQSF